MVECFAHMLDVTQLRAGTVFEEYGALFLVLKYEHSKVGRGTASIRVKIRNLKSGATTDRNFINGARVQDVTLEKRRGQYLYNDGSDFVFMDPQTFEQFNVSKDLVGEQGRFLKDGTEVDLKFYTNQPISIALPLKMKFTVTDTEPGFKGNTVTNVYKDAVIDTGATVKVPMFIEPGEQIVVNTDTGQYAERANK